MLTKELHPQNTLTPMLVTLLGMTILDKERQLQNASSPTQVTLFGMTTLVKELHW